ncbi:MAG: nitronate monooxygenase [Cytophagales bacterium]
MENRITSLLQIEYPIIQAGMVWCSGWRLASAVSNEGALGVIGAGSMSSQLLEEHIVKFKNTTNKPFAVNLPLIYAHIQEQIDVILKHEVPIVITSAGSPETYTQLFKSKGIRVIHVVSSLKFALKAQNAGVDAVIAEGFEAGGHNGRDETTTFCLIPHLSNHLSIPIIAAGGIACGKTMKAALVLGASAVQIGSLFAISEESSASLEFKKAVINAQEGDTELVLKKLNPVRLLKNSFYQTIKNAENNCASVDELKVLLGKGKSKLGIYDGQIEDGELEIGQVSMRLTQIKSCKQIISEILSEYNTL